MCPPSNRHTGGRGTTPGFRILCVWVMFGCLDVVRGPRVRDGKLGNIDPDCPFFYFRSCFIRMYMVEKNPRTAKKTRKKKKRGVQQKRKIIYPKKICTSRSVILLRFHAHCFWLASRLRTHCTVRSCEDNLGEACCLPGGWLKGLGKRPG